MRSLVFRRPELALLVAPFLVLALVLASCSDTGSDTPVEDPATPGPGPSAPSDGTPAPSPTATPAAGSGQQGLEVEPPRDTAWGIAGLVPANFPASTDDDWLEFYESLPELGGWVGTFASWTPDAGMPDVMRSQAQVGQRFGFQTLPAVGFGHQGIGQYELVIDFTDPEQVAHYRDAVADLARDLRPPFLGLGNEMNLLWEDDPAAFDAIAQALPEIADAVRAASPGTRVFTTFQLEFLRGGGRISGVQRQPQWDLLDELGPALDLVAFTSYPWFDFESPADIPDDYYEEVAARVDGPIAFSELGWPGAPLTAAPDSPFGGSPEEQAAFIERLHDLLVPLEPQWAFWVFAHDSEVAGALFDVMGLREQDGEPRPALESWRALIDPN